MYANLWMNIAFEFAIKIDLCQHFVQICYELIAMARRQNGCCYLADHIH
jgi:hypothetical protein